MNRKAQVTISILLIFLILFSVFSLVIYAERETISTTNFRNAVDAAALTAGADLAKGIGLYITITGIRLVLYGLGIILFVVGIIFPGAFGTVSNMIQKIPKISHALEYLSRYIPIVYTAIAEIDANKVFVENLQKNDEDPNTAHLVVLPNSLIEIITELINDTGKINDENIIEKIKNTLPNVKYNESPTNDNIINSLNILRDGFVIFAYKDKPFLKKEYENISRIFGSGEKFSSNFLDDHEFALVEVKPIKRVDKGVDLSDAVRISLFLNGIEDSLNGKIESEKVKSKIVGDYQCEMVQSIYDFILQSTSDTKSLINFWGNFNNVSPFQEPSIMYKIDKELEPYENEEKEIIDKLRSCSCGIQSGSECDNEIKKHKSVLNEIIGARNYLKEMLPSDFSQDIIGINETFNGIKNAYGYLKTTVCDKEPIEDRTDISDFRSRIERIRKYCGNALNYLLQLDNKLRKIEDVQTGSCCAKKNEKGECVCFCDNSINITPGTLLDLNNGMISPLRKISSSAYDCLYLIDGYANKIKGQAEDGFNDIINDVITKAKGLAKSFTGFPGGNTLSFLVDRNGFNCEENCKGNPYLCVFGDLGKFVCAIKEDFDKLDELSKGKFDLVSYYSPMLSAPEWLENYTVKEVNIQNLSLKTILLEVMQNAKNNILIDLNTGFDGSDLSQTISNSTTSAIIGLLMGGPIYALLNVIVDQILSYAQERVINLIQDQVLSVLNNAITNSFKDTEIWKTVDSALLTFFNKINDLLKVPYRLLGDNESRTVRHSKDRNFSFLFCILMDRVTFDERSKVENKIACSYA